MHTLENYPLTIHMFHSTAYIRQQITAFVTVGVLCLLIAACLAYLLFRRNNRWIKEPVNHIQAVLGEMEQGQSGGPLPRSPHPGIQKIGSSVNHMAAKLQEKIRNEYELLIAQKNLQFQACSLRSAPTLSSTPSTASSPSTRSGRQSCSTTASTNLPTFSAMC